MNKKKHQNDANGDESTESCDENQNNVECAHIRRAIDLTAVKKSLEKNGFQTDCQECAKTQGEDSEMKEDEEDVEYDLSLWMCLKCGNQACGRGKNQHALKHFNTPHSDSHAMCVNTTIWSVWCYDCDDEVNITCKKKLLEVVDYVKKQADTTKRRHANNVAQATERILNVVATLPISQSPSITANGLPNGLPRARGLSNLGNTCFFNSVMQCLGQTPYLLSLLEETAQAGQYFRLPGGTCHLGPSNRVELDPLDGNLEKWRPLCETLAMTLGELQSGRSEVYNPRMLLSRLANRMPQFGCGDQQDSHELLRHLLEAMREEDSKRYKTIILEKLGLSPKTDPATVDEAKKKIIKFYGQQASQMLPTEQVFQGILVSTLQCQTCQHQSHRDESFLDLSLPISEKQMPPVLRRKADDSLYDDGGAAAQPSKHQIKKEKRAERRKHKKHKRGGGVGASDVLRTSVAVDSNGDAADSESGADVEDNAEDSNGSNLRANEAVKGSESGYNSDKIDNSSPDWSNRPTNDAMEEPDERPPSRLAFAQGNSKSMEAGLQQLSLMNDGGDSNKQRAAPMEEEEEEAEGACALQWEKMEEDDDDDDEEDDDNNKDEDDEEEEAAAVAEEEENDNMWTGTMAARYQCEERECSVQSCLNQFTECELMAGNNRVGCDLCTKRHGGPDKRTVNTDASKQLLIYNPPAVLILHLKRFQVCRFRPAKVSKFVKFSPLLDLAPFCSKRSSQLPTFRAGQSRVLYALYGVVEHSGTMHGGHYVSYIKVRPPLAADSHRWSFLPKNQQQQQQQAGRCAPVAAAAAAAEEPQPPPGKWYRISDSYVAETTEAKVLGAEAYLLFYERIF